MQNTDKKTRIEFLYGVFNEDYKNAIKLGKLVKISGSGLGSLEDKDDPGNFGDQNFYSFYLNELKPNNLITGKTHIELLFNFFQFCDPTPHKEYLTWLITLYRRLCKGKLWESTGEGNDTVETLGNVFFEDLYTKVKGALEIYSFLKRTNVLSVENRDINRFKEYNSFVNMVAPYMVDEDDDTDESVHTLNHKELSSIQNYLNYKQSGDDDGCGLAELVFENKNWIIVHTHDKIANKEFGRSTTWCTAGTRHGDMFNSYNTRGKLFVLIKKGMGSRLAIKKDPTVRMQFHFEDGQFMQAEDRSIDINKFLFDNKDIKEFFRTYIIKSVLPKRQLSTKSSQSDDVSYLLKLGYGDEIITIFKELKPERIDFSGHKIQSEYLERIGEITSIKRLDLSNCGLTYLPESIRNLKDLRTLKINENPDIKRIPSWISELTKLQNLHFAACDIQEDIDLGGNLELEELSLDYNSKLTSLPSNIDKLKKLIRLTAASCNLQEIDDSILNCTKLFVLDVHENKELTKIPTKISLLPGIMVISIDDTKIPKEIVDELNAIKTKNVTIIKYEDVK